jgi:glycosyltransferase involved in cell wall biosynthesis
VPILHTGVDAERFRPGEIRESRPTIVFVGKLVENKGVLDLARAARSLLTEFPDLQVWMIGEGDTRIIERLQAIGKETATSFLRLTGFVARDELPQWLARAHVFAAPSIYEGGPGFVYLEAMSCGLPVIACSGSGASEVIAHGETGYLVPPHDPAALSDALRSLLANPSLAEAMGRRARDYVLAEANTPACLQRIVALYESVVARHRQQRMNG